MQGALTCATAVTAFDTALQHAVGTHRYVCVNEYACICICVCEHVYSCIRGCAYMYIRMYVFQDSGADNLGFRCVHRSQEQQQLYERVKGNPGLSPKGIVNQ
jgi:hypothetical protein